MNVGALSWHPSCVIVMTIRFDEALQLGKTGEVVTARTLAAQTQNDRTTGNKQVQQNRLKYPLFSDEGPAFYKRAYNHNLPYAVPQPWVTTLASFDEFSFRTWVAAFGVPFDPNAAIVDYDMRGYWHDFIKPGGAWVRGHFPDTWKTPFDTTFSAESKYATANCPFKWSGDRLFDTKTGELIFGQPVPLPGQPAASTSPTKKHRPRRALNEQAEIDRRVQNAQLAQLDDFAPQQGSQFAVPGTTPVTASAGQKPTEPGGSTVPLTFGTDGFTVISNRVPKRGTFVQPHPRTAGTFNLSFDYHEFPVDPRLIRAVGIEVHVGAVSAEDYARGMAGEKDTDGRPLSVLKTTSGLVDPWSGRPAANNQTLLFYATADTWEVDHSDKGSSITLEGRDVRGIFIDAKVPSAKAAKVDLTKPIDKVVEALIKTMGVEHDLRMTIMTDAAEWPNGTVPSPGDADGLTRVRLSAAGDQTRSTPATGAKTTYWDLITNYCTLVGAMPVFVGSTLWIRPNQRIFDVLDKRKHTRTPFAGGRPRQVAGEQIRVRRMVYGRDLKRLRFQRKFAGAVVPAIQCLSFDDRQVGMQRLIMGQWPPGASVAAQAKAETEVLRIPIWGVRSVDQLTEIAHGIYEEIGRGETGGTAETSNLASYGGGNADPDLLRLRPLDPVEFVVDAQALRTVAPVVSELNDAERMTFSEEVDLLTRRLGDRTVARALVALARGAVRELLAFYQVIGVQYDWDSGIRTSFTFQNYIVPRHHAKATKPTRAGADPRQTRVDVPGGHRKAKMDPALVDAFDHRLDSLDSLDALGMGDVKNAVRKKRVRQHLGAAWWNADGKGAPDD